MLETFWFTKMVKIRADLERVYHAIPNETPDQDNMLRVMRAVDTLIEASYKEAYNK